LKSTYQLCSVNFHSLLRELVGHCEQISRDFDRIFESHAVVVCHTAHKALTYAQLPCHRLEPLLCDAYFDCLDFGTFQICWNRFGKLCLYLCIPCRVRVCVYSIPKVDEGVVDDFVQCYEEFESHSDRSIGRHFIQRWWMYGWIKGHWAVLVQCVCSVYLSAMSTCYVSVCR
jgi:hypothetical protein